MGLGVFAPPRRILLFTDFGPGSPYTGQMQLVLAGCGAPVIELASDAPVLRPLHAGFLLRGGWPQIPSESLVLGVVDPGVGGARETLVAHCDGRWLLGPDNGLFAPLLRRAQSATVWRLRWDRPVGSNSFHGRDLFAPAAAALVRGEDCRGQPLGREAVYGMGGEDQLNEVIYLDHYGNAMTGLDAGPVVGRGLTLMAGEARLREVASFCFAAPGEAFWYANSQGLVEIAVNGGRADRVLGLEVGSQAGFEPGGAG